MINRKHALILTVVTAVLMISGSLSLVYSETTSAADIIDGDFEYTIIDGGVSVVYTGSAADVVIPAQVTSGSDTFDVIEIGVNGFSDNFTLQTVTLPSTLKVIGFRAFNSCIDLSNINLGNVNIIEPFAFNYCIGLTSITIPSSVTSIGTSAFQSCYSLTSVTMPSVTSIGNYAFQNCTDLTTIDLGSVTSIGTSAFQGCTGLTSITMPSSVTSIGTNAFQGCTRLITIDLGSVTSIGNNAFYGCTGLTSITIPSSVTSIGNNAFYGCTGLTSITIPSSVTFIASGAFYNCISLETAYISMQILSVNWNIFTGCTSLQTVYVGPLTTLNGTALGSVVVLDRWILPQHTPASLTTIDGDPWSFTAILNVPNVNITLDGPEWLTLNGNTISGVPPALADGTDRQEYTVSLVYAKDGYLGSAQVFTLTVMAAESEPEEPTCPEEPGTGDEGSKNIIDKIVDAITGFFKAIADFFVGIWNAIVDFFRGFADYLVGIWNSIVEFFTGLWPLRS